jgi:radical SAM enzyme (TIGR01210 family)
VTLSAVDQRIRSLRPPKPPVDPYKAHGYLRERERTLAGGTEESLTVFLAGAECPFTCSFCDLWRWTVDGPTRPGALATQLEVVLQQIKVDGLQRLKLYNASNFFDSRAVPPEDLARIAILSRQFAAVTVESHASTIGAKAVDFARAISGRLEVAVGLETVHPVASARLNKRLELARFDRAAGFLSENCIDLRVFVLLGTPHVPVHESLEWTLRTVEYAVKRGAKRVSIIPLRGGNGEMERLRDLGDFRPPSLSDLETALDDCAACAPARIARLGRVNSTGVHEPPIACDICGAS